MNFKAIKNEKGVALLSAFMIMALLTALGLSAANTSTTELKIASNEKTATQALYAAEAGINFAIATLTADISNLDNYLTDPDGTINNLKEDEPIGTSSTYTVKIIDNNDETTGNNPLDDVDNTVIIKAEGTAGSSTKNITVVAYRPTISNPYINYAAFGETGVYTKNSGKVRSYDSSVTPNPTDTDADGDGIADDETGGGDIGSNGEVEIKNNAYIGGNIALGADTSGTVATLSDHGGTVTGTESFDATGTLTGVTVDPVDSDVMFTDGGAVNVAMDTLADMESAGTLTSLDISKNSTTVLSVEEAEKKPIPGCFIDAEGTLNCYFSEINTKNNGTIQIEGTVNIYLTGSMELKNSVEIINTGVPANFSIYSSTTDTIDIKHNSSFSGLLYAPYSDIILHNSGDVYGAIYGDTVDIRNTGEIWFDTALRDSGGSTLSDKLAISSWIEN
jgi:Tfp pilus assembly protein PilX